MIYCSLSSDPVEHLLAVVSGSFVHHSSKPVMNLPFIYDACKMSTRALLYQTPSFPKIPSPRGSGELAGIMIDPAFLPVA